MNRMEIRTDLALEAREDIEAKGERESGVMFSEQMDETTGIRVTTVQIVNEEGAKSIGKPVGTYITLEAESLELPDEDCHRQVSEKLSEYLLSLVRSTTERVEENPPAVLAVGLGNRAVTSDSLGPKVVDELWITRHLENASPKISGIVPGVMAQTGMESAELVRGAAELIRPDLVVAVDALAARSTERLAATVQLSDTGIQPGSGIGNGRRALNRETVGVPVMALGVPTVVESSTLVYDALTKFGIDEQREELQQLFEGGKGFFVAPKEIDLLIPSVGILLSSAIEKAFTVS